MSYNIINKKGNSNFQNVQPVRFPCENESVIQEMFKTTSKNTEELQNNFNSLMQRAFNGELFI